MQPSSFLVLDMLVWPVWGSYLWVSTACIRPWGPVNRSRPPSLPKVRLHRDSVAPFRSRNHRANRGVHGTRIVDVNVGLTCNIAIHGHLLARDRSRQTAKWMPTLHGIDTVSSPIHQWMIPLPPTTWRVVRCLLASGSHFLMATCLVSLFFFLRKLSQ